MPTEPSAPLLSFDDAQKHFPVRGDGLFGGGARVVRAVDGVSFDIAPGETLAFVGESGCGKTTLVKLALRIEQPTSGAIRFRGRPLADLDRSELQTYRSTVQAVFQDPTSSLNPRLDVAAIVGEPVQINTNLSRTERLARVREMLRLVGLPDDSWRRYSHEFSGGQRQRIAIARALALRPSLIVLDEAVSALDVSIQAQILNLLKELQGAFGLSYLFVSHNLATVRYMSDRVAVMYLGRIVETGPSESVFERRLHPYTRALLAAALPAHPQDARPPLSIAGEVPSALNLPSGCRFRTRCPLAQDICANVEPPLAEFGGGHRAACHFAGEPDRT